MEGELGQKGEDSGNYVAIRIFLEGSASWTR